MTVNFVDPHSLNIALKQEEGFFSGYDLVSFDIFETLVRRARFLRPTDLFLELGKRLSDQIQISNEDFAQLRIRAERHARSTLEAKGRAEVRLFEIYTVFLYLLSCRGTVLDRSINAQFLMNAEMELELENLEFIEETRNILNKAIASKSKVALISDFYAPTSFIEGVLEKNNIRDFDLLLVSSDVDQTKHHGDLYDVALSKLKVDRHRVLHVGDNPWSDGSQAARKGLQHYRISNPEGRLSRFLELSNNDYLNPFISSFFVRQARHCFGTECAPRSNSSLAVPEQIGRLALAPLLLGMSSWLYSEAAEPGPSKPFFFCARDGLVMKKVFDLLQKKFGVRTKSTYIAVSRQVIYRANGAGDVSFAREKFLQNWTSLAPRAALRRWGLDASAFADEIRAAGFSNEDEAVVIGDRTGARKLAELFRLTQDRIMSACVESKQTLVEYLGQMGVSGSPESLLIDIGWHGSLQSGLQQVLGPEVQISGRYLGLFLGDDDPLAPHARGYLFSRDGVPRAREIRRSPSLVELLHTAQHGSTNGYAIGQDRKVVPTFADLPLEEAQFVQSIAPIQESALKAIADFLDSYDGEFAEICPSASFAGLRRLLARPTRAERNFLGGLQIAANFGDGSKMTSLEEVSPQGYRLWNFDKLSK